MKSRGSCGLDGNDAKQFMHMNKPPCRFIPWV